jgi:lipopolysaccharide export system permease protein
VAGGHPAQGAPFAGAGKRSGGMTAATTLFRYILRHFLVNFAGLVVILLGLVFIFDVIELMRRAAGAQDVPLGAVLMMAALKLPEVGQKVIPFAVLFAAIYTCWKLNKTSELVVIRAAGISAWQFLSPMVSGAFLIGIAVTTVVNPAGAVMLGKFERMETAYFNTVSNLMTVSRTGIWLRQPAEDGYALFHANSFDQQHWRMQDVIVFFFDREDSFQKRYDSPHARLDDGFWALADTRVNTGENAQREALVRLPTELTARQIEESFASPETMSFWMIPEHLRIMTEAGFSATRLSIHFHSLLALPFLLAAMVLLAATFSLRPQRFGGTGVMIGLGVGVGFFIFFMESMLQAFGISQKIPVYLAAWTPAIVSLLMGTTALLHMEDG